MAEEKGLPMTSRWEPEKLAKEIADLEELKTIPLGAKTWGYVKRSGPGLLQSAMTLGAGSAAASVAAGAAFGYKLLWVQPIAMLLGVCMLAALSNVVLTTQERPYKAFGRELGPFGFLVFLWALGTIMASVIWHFPQYSLAAGAVRDLVSILPNAPQLTPDATHAALGWLPYTAAGVGVSLLAGLVILGINILTVWSYGSSASGVKFYERFLQLIIALIIVSFGIVVFARLGDIKWAEVGKGYCGYYAAEVLFNPDGTFNSTNLVMVLGMLGAAVGINMTFLYPYSLLAKGWGPAHKTVAKWDLGMSMFVPFVLVTSLIMIAMTVGGVYPYADDISKLKPLEASKALVGVIGPSGRVIFDLGLIGMSCGAISAHMVVCGFTVCEMFKLDYTKWRFRLFAMVPSIGFFGVLINLPFWLPVAASAVCFTMLPIAYLIFFIMNNKRSYIGDAVGKGFPRLLFNLILLIAVLTATIGACIAIKQKVIKPIQDNMKPKAAVEQKAAPAESTPAPAALPAKDGSESK